MQAEIGEFEKKIKEMETAGDADPQAAMQAVQQLASRQRLAQRRLDTKIEQMKRKRDTEVEAVERQLESKIRKEHPQRRLYPSSSAIPSRPSHLSVPKTAISSTQAKS
jgi:uncharacterized membrane protein YqiK